MEPKDFKKYLLPAFAVFVVITCFSCVFHGMFMEKLYLENSHLFRPQDEIQKHKYYFWLANIIYSIAFCYIYSKGHEKKGSVMQGVRFGLWVTLLVWLPETIVKHVIFSYPTSLLGGWLIGYTVQSILAGMTASAVFQKGK